MTVEQDGPRLDLRLAPAAVTSWAVTVAGILWHAAGSVVMALIATALAVAATAALRWWSGRCDDPLTVAHYPVAGVIAVAVVGMGFAVAIGLRDHQMRQHPIGARYGATATVVLTPDESPRSLGGGRLMFRASLRALDGVEMSGRVVVFTPVLGYSDLTVGRPASLRARIGPPTRRDLTVAVLSAAGRPTLGEPPMVQRMAQRVRTAFADAARTALPAEQAAMLPGLVLGDTSAVTGRTTDDFRASGLTHLTAVSGANVTIVCGAALLTAGLVGPRAAVVIAAVVLIAFVIVVQPSASVLRAAVMGAVTLLGMVTGRRRQAIPALAASIIVLMVAAPQLAIDIGFALSVSATAALVVIAPIWSRRLVQKGWPKPLADAVSVAVAAQLVTAPLVAGISGTFSVVSVAANLAAAAVVAPITVIGTAAAVLSTVWPPVAQLLIRFTGPEVWWLLEVAHSCANAPGAVVPMPSGLVGTLMVAAGGIAVLVLWRWRWFRLGTGAAALCLLAWTVSGFVGRP